MGDQGPSAADLDRCRTILDLIRLHAARQGDAVAITAPGRAPLSRAGLLALVERTAASLSASGITRSDRVAIVLPNGPEMATSFLGVAAACTAAPLNPGYTASEFEFYLSDLGARVLLVEETSSSPAVDVARALGITVLSLAAESHVAGSFRLRGAPDIDDVPERVRAEDIALVLHTSGTTSRPKIVPLSHANLCISALNIRRTLNLTADDRCLNVMPLFHIHGLVAAVLASLAAGGSVCCTSGFRADDFFHWLDEERPTWFTAVPTIHQAILSISRPIAEPRAASRLRFVRSSSAPLPPRVMQELEERLGAPVIEAYGMTEAAHQMASNPLPPGQRIPGSVGVPTGVELVLLDEAGAPVRTGDQGEIAIRGPSVITGYEANDEANASSFTRGLFRTGDLGRFNADGYLFLTGRIKEIINRGGEKIAPGEVDTTLLEHPSVFQAVSFGVPHETLGEDIVAAIVVRPGTMVTETELRDFAAARLASFKVPRRLLLVGEIPKGPTGKLKRRALSELLARQLSESVMPRTPTEHLLAQLWSEVLGVKSVGVCDNFSAIGGDSLRATAIAARAQQIGLPLEAQMLFDHPTIEELARILTPNESNT